MKLRSILCCAVAVSVCVGSVNAFPSLPGYVKDGYKDDNDHKAFLEMVDGLKTKCDVCHKPGADKKGKGHGLNDFGKVFHDRFNPKAFKAANDDPNKKAEALKIVKETWDKSIKEKNAEGKIYGDLIKEGKLPGKND